MLDPRLIEIISRNFGLEKEQVTPQTSADSVAEWDSVGHLSLILELEETFRVRFPAAEIGALRSAGAIQEALNRIVKP